MPSKAFNQKNRSKSRGLSTEWPLATYIIANKVLHEHVCSGIKQNTNANHTHIILVGYRGGGWATNLLSVESVTDCGVTYDNRVVCAGAGLCMPVWRYFTAVCIFLSNEISDYEMIMIMARSINV